MKRNIAWLLSAALLFCMLFGCGEKRIVHCDRCGKEIEVDADSNVTEDWILVCQDCQKELYPDS